MDAKGYDRPGERGRALGTQLREHAGSDPLVPSIQIGLASMVITQDTSKSQHFPLQSFPNSQNISKCTKTHQNAPKSQESLHRYSPHGHLPNRDVGMRKPSYHSLPILPFPSQPTHFRHLKTFAVNRIIHRSVRGRCFQESLPYIYSFSFMHPSPSFAFFLPRSPFTRNIYIHHCPYVELLFRQFASHYSLISGSHHFPRLLHLTSIDPSILSIQNPPIFGLLLLKLSPQ